MKMRKNQLWKSVINFFISFWITGQTALCAFSSSSVIDILMQIGCLLKKIQRRFEAIHVAFRRGFSMKPPHERKGFSNCVPYKDDQQLQCLQNGMQQYVNTFLGHEAWQFSDVYATFCLVGSEATSR